MIRNKFLNTWKIDLLPPSEGRARSTTWGNSQNKNLAIRTNLINEGDDEEFNHGDECDEAVEDTMKKGKQSITELISMHKLCTSKSQVPKSLVKVNPKSEKYHHQSSFEEEDEESESNSIEIIERRRKPINDWDAFYWLDEFDDIIDGTNSEVFYEWSPFTQVERWSNENGKYNWQIKYQILSSFMDEKANKIRSLNNLIDHKNNKIVRNKSIRHRDGSHSFKGSKKRKLQKSYSMEPKRLTDKSHDVHEHIMTEVEEVIIQESAFNKESRNMIGIIDKYGLFVVDTEVEGIELLSWSITDDAGFFDKIIIDSNFKAWISNMKQTFEVFQSIYDKIFTNSRLKLMWIEDKFENFKDIEAFDDYFSKIKITWFNNPIVANQ